MDCPFKKSDMNMLLCIQTPVSKNTVKWCKTLSYNKFNVKEMQSWKSK